MNFFSLYLYFVFYLFIFYFNQKKNPPASKAEEGALKRGITGIVPSLSAAYVAHYDAHESKVKQVN